MSDLRVQPHGERQWRVSRMRYANPTKASSLNVSRELDRIIEYCDNMIVSHLNRITINPQQCGGRPCIRGMRIRVKDILEMLAAGVPEQEILSDFPYLEPEDIRAALEFAAVQSDHPVLQST